MIRLILVVLACIWAVPALGSVFSYECDTLPADGGWDTINEWCDPDQWTQDGWLVQHTEICDDPPAGQQFDYVRSLDEYDGASTWFVEWRVFGDGDQSEIPFTSPSVLAAGGLGPVNYHFVIARDRLRFVHDVGGEVTYYDISPEGAHVFRVEQRGVASYAVYIDYELVDSGVPGGAFPAHDPAINIRAKSHELVNTVYWDYIRWGDIPADASGDFDSDGQVDENDLYFLSL